jgi:hypothetical protein
MGTIRAHHGEGFDMTRQAVLPAQGEGFTQPAKETATTRWKRRPFAAKCGSLANSNRRLTSCGAESWPASDASCGPAYAALFPISSFPQGLPNGWCDGLLSASPSGESPILAWTSRGRQARSEVGDLSHSYFRRGKPHGLRLPGESSAVRRSKIASIHCEWAIQDSNL